MSGGSFNYLCYKSSEQLLESDSDLAAMEAALRCHNADDAADETAEIREVMKKLREKLDSLNCCQTPLSRL